MSGFSAACLSKDPNLIQYWISDDKNANYLQFYVDRWVLWMMNLSPISTHERFGISVMLFLYWIISFF